MLEPCLLVLSKLQWNDVRPRVEGNAKAAAYDAVNCIYDPCKGLPVEQARL